MALLTIAGSFRIPGAKFVSIVIESTVVTAELIPALETAILTASDGSYSFKLIAGTYNICINDEVFKNVIIDKSGTLNEFLEVANGRDL